MERSGNTRVIDQLGFSATSQDRNAGSGNERSILFPIRIGLLVFGPHNIGPKEFLFV